MHSPAIEASAAASRRDRSKDDISLLPFSRAQKLILAHRKAFDAWMVALRPDAIERPAEEEVVYKVANEAYSSATAALFNHVPESLADASAMAEHLLLHGRRGHFDPEQTFDFLESLSFAPVAENVPAAVAAPAPAWSPRVFESRPIPDDFEAQKASYWAMQQLVDATYGLDNSPRCEAISEEAEDWVVGFRAHQNAIAVRVAQGVLNGNITDRYALDRASDILEHWYSQCESPGASAAPGLAKKVLGLERNAPDSTADELDPVSIAAE